MTQQQRGAQRQQSAAVSTSKTAPKPTDVDLYKPQPVKTVTALLERSFDKLAAVIPSQIDPARFGRLAIALLSKNTDLQACTARSLLVSIAEAAALGLELDPSLGHAYLVPYKVQSVKLAQLIVGYRGYIHLLIATGRVRRVLAHEVYPGDQFDIDQAQERISHTPVDPDNRLSQTIRGCYSVLRYVDNAPLSLDWMWRKDIELVRDGSNGYRYARDNGKPNPWIDHYMEMAKKTVIRRLAKTSDASPTVTRVAAGEEARDVGLDVSLTEFSDAELVGLRTIDTTKKLEDKYRGQQGDQPGAGTGQAGTGAAGKDRGTPLEGGCEAKHAEPGVHCELTKGHRGGHQWRKPEPPEDDVPTAEELDAAGVGREPGGEG